MTRLFFTCLLMGVFILTMGVFPVAPKALLTELPVESGSFTGDGQTYHFERSAALITIRNEAMSPIFTLSSPDSFTVLLSCGYSRSLGSLYVFKETLSRETRRYDLLLETQTGVVPVVTGSLRAFVTPLLIETRGLHVAYLADDGAIVLVDAAAGKILQRLIPKTPASALKLDGSREAPRLTFKRFVRERGTHRDHYIDLDSLGLISCRISEAVRSGEEGAVRPSIGGQRPRPATGTLARDPKTTIGFGDSITYGFLYKQPYPEFGYIPRLLTKLQEEIYEDANLVNEGVGGTKTYEAIQRIDEVILTHGAQNLLFHYGTNDILHVNEVTTAEVVDNIAYMIDRVLDYGMTPVLSTLIPRNTIAADGIYLERALDICTGIRELARERGVSLVDFWRLFSDHPEGDGGYWALMSDNVHPSEKGYQLMAESWHQVLLALPPLTPRPAVLSSVTALRTRAIWPANEELDIHYYEVQFGHSPVLMDRQATTVSPTFEFFRFPYQDQARRHLYFRIRAVDQSGSVSSWAPTQRVSFTTAAVWGEKTGKQ